jgi:hypothetical protein
MIGILLLLAALAVTGVLAAVLVVVIRAGLREREALARMNGPSVPTPQANEAGRPRKPALVPWLVVSGIALVLLTFMGSLLLRSCQAIGERRVSELNQSACLTSTGELARWFAADWDQRKALPPAGAVPVDSSVRCPLGHRFKYVGEGQVMLGQVRVLVVEIEPHESGVRHAVGVAQKFVEAGKTGSEYQQSFPDAHLNPAPGWNAGGYRVVSPFGSKPLSEGEYQAIRQAVEDVP